MDHHRTGDGTNLYLGTFAKRTYSHTSNPPTSATSGGARPVGTLSRSTALFDDSTFRDQAGFQIPPKLDRRFAGEGDNHDAPDAPVLTLGPYQRDLV